LNYTRRSRNFTPLKPRRATPGTAALSDWSGPTADRAASCRSGSSPSATDCRAGARPSRSG